MDAEERKRRVGHRVDETADEVASLGLEHEVVAAERHDPRLGRCAAEAREAVRVDASAHDDAVRLEVAAGRLDRGDPASPREPDDRATEQQLAACVLHVVRVCLDDPREIHDRRLRRVECPHAGDVRLQLAEPPASISSTRGTPFASERR